MKFILFSLNEEQKNYINNLESESLIEITLSKKLLHERLNRKHKGIDKLKNIFYDKSLNKKILKALSNHDTKWYYLLSNKFNVKEKEYLTNKAQELLGYKYNTECEMDKNIFKYINDASAKRKMKKHEVRCLIVASRLNSLNMKLIQNLIKEYKTVNIYLNEKPTSYILNSINKINKEEGTTIEVLRKDKKQLAEFDVVYFVDDVKTAYPRMRLNKKALIIDLNSEDKFNSNIVFLNEYIKKNNIENEKIDNYISEYGVLEFASIIRKIVN